MAESKRTGLYRKQIGVPVSDVINDWLQDYHNRTGIAPATYVRSLVLAAMTASAAENSEVV